MKLWTILTFFEKLEIYLYKIGKKKIILKPTDIIMRLTLDCVIVVIEGHYCRFVYSFLFRKSI